MLEMTEAQYAEQQRLAALTTCATCGAETARDGERHANDVDYCSSLCASFGERKHALADHTRAANAVCVNGWDI